MGGDNKMMQIRRATSGIHDVYRGVFLNRGVFVKAPPSFFQAYPSDFEQPPLGWEKLNVQLREIDQWDPTTGIGPAPEAKLEVPPPTPTVVQTQSVEPIQQKVIEPVAAGGDTTPVPTKKKIRARKAIIR